MSFFSFFPFGCSSPHPFCGPPGGELEESDLCQHHPAFQLLPQNPPLLRICLTLLCLRNRSNFVNFPQLFNYSSASGCAASFPNGPSSICALEKIPQQFVPQMWPKFPQQFLSQIIHYKSPKIFSTIYCQSKFFLVLVFMTFADTHEKQQKYLCFVLF